MTKEKAKQIISAHGLGHTIKEWDEAIAVIFDEPSLSSDVTKAAGEYSQNFSPYFSGFVKEIFMAGAKWAVSQGEPAEINYWNHRGLSIRLDKPLEKLGYEEGDKVVVQIRKVSN